VGSEHTDFVHGDRDPTGLTGIDTHRDHHVARVCQSTSLATNGATGGDTDKVDAGLRLQRLADGRRSGALLRTTGGDTVSIDARRRVVHRCLPSCSTPRSVPFVSTIDDSQRRAIAAYIATVARTFRQLDALKADLYETLGQSQTPRVNRKSLREECWFVWHSFTRTGKGKYSPTLPWSPRAIEARPADPKAPLVIEHVEPFALFCERLEALTDGPVEDVERLLSDVQLVVITTDERTRK
jgi:hypothetical protein